MVGCTVEGIGVRRRVRGRECWVQRGPGAAAAVSGQHVQHRMSSDGGGVIDVRIAEPGPLGLTFAVLQAGDGPYHEFDVRLITGDPAVLRSSSSVSSSTLGGLQLDDGLWVTSVQGSSTPVKQYACRAVDGAARVLVVGQFSIALFDKSVYHRQTGCICSHSIGELEEWCVPLSQPPRAEFGCYLLSKQIPLFRGVGPEVPGEEDPYIFVKIKGDRALKLRASEPDVMCASIMASAQKIAQMNRKHSKAILKLVRNATEIAWHSGARVGQRLVAMNGAPVETMADVEACLQASEDSSWVSTLTLRSGPIVVGNVDPDGVANRVQSDLLKCGLRLMAINDEPVAGRSFSATMKQIREASRPLRLKLQIPSSVQSRPQVDNSDPEVSDGDRAMLKHVEAAQIEHLSNGMVRAKRANTSYEDYLREQMPDDYSHEFVTFERKNERFHEMWDRLTLESELTHEYTDPETNAILDINAITVEKSESECVGPATDESGALGDDQ